MNTRSSLILGTFAVLALAVPLTLSYSSAQQAGEAPSSQGGFGQPPAGGPAGQGPGFGPGQPPQGQPGGFQARPMMGGGGGATMIADGNFLYVLQGNRLLKINKDDLKVAKTAELPMMQGGFGGPGDMPPGNRGGGAAGPGGPGGRGGGGGGEESVTTK